MQMLKNDVKKLLGNHKGKTNLDNSNPIQLKCTQRPLMKLNLSYVLVSIDLQNCDIQDANILSSCTILRYVRLSGNIIEKIPNCIQNMRCLQFLDLSSNKISTPKSIVMLESAPDTLLYLNLMNNKITQQPRYREFIIKMVSSLVALDSLFICDEESVSYQLRLSHVHSPEEIFSVPPPLISFTLFSAIADVHKNLDTMYKCLLNYSKSLSVILRIQRQFRKFLLSRKFSPPVKYAIVKLQAIFRGRRFRRELQSRTEQLLVQGNIDYSDFLTNLMNSPQSNRRNQRDDANYTRKQYIFANSNLLEDLERFRNVVVIQRWYRWSKLNQIHNNHIQELINKNCLGFVFPESFMKDIVRVIPSSSVSLVDGIQQIKYLGVSCNQNESWSNSICIVGNSMLKTAHLSCYRSIRIHSGVVAEHNQHLYTSLKKPHFSLFMFLKKRCNQRHVTVKAFDKIKNRMGYSRQVIACSFNKVKCDKIHEQYEKVFWLQCDDRTVLYKIFFRLDLLDLWNSSLVQWDTTVFKSVAATQIQCQWRAYRIRYTVSPMLLSRLLKVRACVAIQRWWRMRVGLYRRLQLLSSICRQRRLINSPVLYMDAWLYFSILRRSQSPDPKTYSTLMLPEFGTQIAIDSSGKSFVIVVPSDNSTLSTQIDSGSTLSFEESQESFCTMEQKHIMVIAHTTFSLRYIPHSSHCNDTAVLSPELLSAKIAKSVGTSLTTDDLQTQPPSPARHISAWWTSGLNVIPSSSLSSAQWRQCIPLESALRQLLTHHVSVAIQSVCDHRPLSSPQTSSHTRTGSNTGIAVKHATKRVSTPNGLRHRKQTGINPKEPLKPRFRVVKLTFASTEEARLRSTLVMLSTYDASRWTSFSLMTAAELETLWLRSLPRFDALESTERSVGPSVAVSDLAIGESRQVADSPDVIPIEARFFLYDTDHWITRQRRYDIRDIIRFRLFLEVTNPVGIPLIRGPANSVPCIAPSTKPTGDVGIHKQMTSIKTPGKFQPKFPFTRGSQSSGEWLCVGASPRLTAIDKRDSMDDDGIEIDSGAPHAVDEDAYLDLRTNRNDENLKSWSIRSASAPGSSRRVVSQPPTSNRQIPANVSAPSMGICIPSNRPLSSGMRSRLKSVIPSINESDRPVRASSSYMNKPMDDFRNNNDIMSDFLERVIREKDTLRYDEAISANTTEAAEEEKDEDLAHRRAKRLAAFLDNSHLIHMDFTSTATPAKARLKAALVENTQQFRRQEKELDALTRESHRLGVDYKRECIHKERVRRAQSAGTTRANKEQEKQKLKDKEVENEKAKSNEKTCVQGKKLPEEKTAMKTVRNETYRARYCAKTVSRAFNAIGRQTLHEGLQRKRAEEAQRAQDRVNFLRASRVSLKISSSYRDDQHHKSKAKPIPFTDSQDTTIDLDDV